MSVSINIWMIVHHENVCTKCADKTFCTLSQYPSYFRTVKLYRSSQVYIFGALNPPSTNYAVQNSLLISTVMTVGPQRLLTTLWFTTSISIWLYVLLQKFKAGGFVAEPLLYGNSKKLIFFAWHLGGSQRFTNFSSNCLLQHGFLSACLTQKSLQHGYASRISNDSKLFS